MSVDDRDRPVGSPCPRDECKGTMRRNVSSSHVQDVLHTEQSAVSRGLRNPTGAFKEKMQEIVKHSNQVGLKQKRKLKGHFNL
jgi:hypothetical protein